LRRACSVAVLLAAALAACGPASGGRPGASPTAGSELPDVRLAKDRPPVVLVSREGDPTGALSLAIATGALDPSRTDDDAEPATALAGLVEARLAARGLPAVVVPSWSGVRATLLVTEGRAGAVAETLRDALSAAVDEKDVAAAKRKLEALGARPLPDAALARWARCVGAAHTLPSRAGTKASEDLTATKLEVWRSAAIRLGRVAIAVAGPLAMGESVAAAVARAPAWKAGSAPSPSPPASAAAIDAAVYEAGPDAAGPAGAAVVHATLDMGTASRAVTTAEALGDPHGPLAARLASLDLPFRVREVAGTADARGGCVGVVLEAAASTASASPGAASHAADLAARVADAVALVHVEARVHLTEGGAATEGRALARRAGDAREAAERAAWWALADAWAARTDPMHNAAIAMRGSVALGVPSKRGSAPGAAASIEPSREALASALERAAASWQKPVAEGRVRVEPGQGEAWVLVASPCGTDAETDADAGLTALVAMTAAEMARGGREVRVEPWIVPDGAGVLVHGAALPGETPAAHARRLADVGARSFASEPIAPSALARARAELVRGETRSLVAPALGALAAGVTPGHASWFVATGREEILARAADSAVVARAQALRAGPLRVAVLANVDASQAEAAVRAADRWIDRRAGDARACRPSGAPASPRAGTYAIEPRGGASPEAYLAFPLAPDDETARGAASVVAAALDGEGGLLEKALGASGLARAWSARVLGAPRAPALVVRIASSQASLDGAVMQTRALVDRVRAGGLARADYDRAVASGAREAIAAALDPRARVVATFRGDAIPSPSQPPRPRATPEEVARFAQKSLGEEAMVVVAARPPRTKAP